MLSNITNATMGEIDHCRLFYLFYRLKIMFAIIRHPTFIKIEKKRIVLSKLVH